MQNTASSEPILALEQSLTDRSSVQLPNLVLAGAPKCGTSSLFSWLTAHPQVCGTDPKETFYFMDSTNPLQRSEANYLKHRLSRYQFFPEFCAAKVFMEATTHYLYQCTARDFFAACRPQPVILFVLRQPSDRILSSFRYTQNNLAHLDRQVSFAQYVELLLADQVDHLRPQFYREKSFYVLQRDLRYSQYVDYLKSWAECFAADRLKVILFEQLKADPQAVLLDLAEQLGLDPGFFRRGHFQQKNQTVAIQSAWMHRNLRQLAPLLPNTRFKRLLKSVYFGIQQKPQAFSSSDDLQALEQLDRYFEPFNQQLADAFQLDLKVWERAA